MNWPTSLFKLLMCHPVAASTLTSEIENSVQNCFSNPESAAVHVKHRVAGRTRRVTRNIYLPSHSGCISHARCHDNECVGRQRVKHLPHLAVCCLGCPSDGAKHFIPPFCAATSSCCRYCCRWRFMRGLLRTTVASSCMADTAWHG